MRKIHFFKLELFYVRRYPPEKLLKLQGIQYTTHPSSSQLVKQIGILLPAVPLPSLSEGSNLFFWKMTKMSPIWDANVFQGPFS